MSGVKNWDDKIWHEKLRRVTYTMRHGTTISENPKAVLPKSINCREGHPTNADVE